MNSPAMWVRGVAPSSTSAINGDRTNSTNTGNAVDFGIGSASNKVAHSLAVGCPLAVSAAFPVGSIVLDLRSNMLVSRPASTLTLLQPVQVAKNLIGMASQFLPSLARLQREA